MKDAFDARPHERFDESTRSVEAVDDAGRRFVRAGDEHVLAAGRHESPGRAGDGLGFGREPERLAGVGGQHRRSRDEARSDRAHQPVVGERGAAAGPADRIEPGEAQDSGNAGLGSVHRHGF